MTDEEVQAEVQLDAAVNEIVQRVLDRRAQISALEAQVAQEKRLLADDEEAVHQAWMATDTDGARLVHTNPITGDQRKVTVSLRDANGVTIKKEDKPRFLEWLRARGDGHLIREEVPSSTLKAHVLELADKGEPLPEFVKIWRGRKLGYNSRSV
jgi:hypothetical protein